MRLLTNAVVDRLPLLVAVALALVAPAQSHADPVNPNFVVPSIYGDPNTTYQEWFNNFTLTSTSPPLDASNLYGMANITDTSYPSDGAFLVNGDIYSFADVTNPEIVVPNAGLGSGYTTTIIFQFETYGSENPNLPMTVGSNYALTSSDLTLTGSDGTHIGAASVILEASLNDGDFGGFGTAFTNDYIATWVVSGSAPSYTINYDSAVTSSAFTSARVDTLTMAAQSVPEPASIVSLSLGLIGLGSWSLHRRRKAIRTSVRARQA